MSKANECRAKDPRTCYYHGAVISMNEAMARISTAGGTPTPADWDIVFEARKRIEQAEAELQRQKWLRETMGRDPEMLTIEDSIQNAQNQAFLQHQQTPQQPQRPQQPAQVDNSGYLEEGMLPPQKAPQKAAQTPQRNARPERPQKNERYAGRQNYKNPKAKRPRKIHTVGKVTVPPRAYDEGTFPKQVVKPNHQGQDILLTRHDQATSAPHSGIMVVVNQDLTPQARATLMGLVKYQHTMSSRDNAGKIHALQDNEIVVNHSKRGVFIASHFGTGPEAQNRANHFVNEIQQIIEQGTAMRQTGTRKYEGLGENYRSSVYYA